MANKLILSKIELNFAESSDDNNVYIWEGNIDNVNILIDKKYFIYWDNKEFECNFVLNENIITLNDENIPFQIYINTSDNSITILTDNNKKNHTISIYEYINHQLEIANHRGQKQILGEYDNIVFNTPNKEKIVYSKLPEVTSEDDGKILGIADGIWQKLNAKIVSSWNDLTDKPFEKRIFTENGTTLPTSIVEIPEYNVLFGKFFNTILTEEEYFSSTFYIRYHTGGASIYEPQTECLNIDNKVLIDTEELIIICYEPCTVNIEGINVTFIEPGIYFGTFSNFDELKEFILSVNYTKKLNEDFSPVLENKIDIISLIPETDTIGRQFYWDDSFGCWTSLLNRTKFALEQDIEKAWNEFVELKVDWGGSQYNVTPQKIIWNDTEYIAAGNLINFGGTGNGEPFIIVGGNLLNNNIFNLLLMDISREQFEGTMVLPITIDLLYNPSKKIKTEYINQINWFQNDPNAGDFIKNRPFGSYKEGTILYDGTLNLYTSINLDSDSYYEYVAPYDGPIPPLDSVINITIDNSFTYSKIVDGDLAENDDQIGMTILLEDEHMADGHTYIISIAKYHTDNIGIIAVVTTNPNLEHINMSFQHNTNCPIPIIYIPEQIRTNLLPEVQSTDNGKIMTVLDGKWQMGTLPSSLPAVSTSDSGKFLRVNSSGQWVAQSITNAEGVSF